MDINLSTWKQRAAIRLRGAGSWIKQHVREGAPFATYGALCTLSLWPLVEAAQQGQVLPVMMALGSVAGGVGGNLIANQIQSWKDRAEAVSEDEVAGWVAQNATNADVRAALDAILTEFKAMTTAREKMKQADQAEFVTLLRGELKRLGNQRKFQAELAGAGAIAQGKQSQAVGARGVASRKSIKKSTIVTGDKNVVQRGRTNIQARTVNIGKASREAGKPSERTLRDAYLKRLMAEIAPLRLGGIDSKSASERQASELKLSAVYTGLLTRQPERSEQLEQKATARQQLTLFEHETPKLSALAALNQQQHLVLLGDPGGGKSTFVNFVAL